MVRGFFIGCFMTQSKKICKEPVVFCVEYSLFSLCVRVSAVKIAGAVTGLLLGLFVFKVSYIFYQGKTHSAAMFDAREKFL